MPSLAAASERLCAMVMRLFRSHHRLQPRLRRVAHIQQANSVYSMDIVVNDCDKGV